MKLNLTECYLYAEEQGTKGEPTEIIYSNF